MTTANLQTIGAGKTHATLLDFSNWLHTRDLVLNDEWIDARLYDDTVLGTVQLYPYSYSANHFVWLRPAVGLGVNEISATGELDYHTSGVQLHRVSGSAHLRVSRGARVSGFRIRISGTSSGSGILISADGGPVGAGPDGPFPPEVVHNRILIDTGVGAGNGINGNHGAVASVITDNLIIQEGAGGTAVVIGNLGKFLRNTIISRGAAAGRSAVTNSNTTASVRDNVFSGCGEVPMVRANYNPVDCTNNFSDTVITGTATGFTVVSPIIVSTTDARPTESSPLIGAASLSAQNTNDIRGGFRGTVPDVGAVMRNAASLPNTANATITSVEVVGQRITVRGTYTSIPSSGVLNLTPAATPNGAVAKSVSVTYANGVFVAVAAGTIPGNYAVPAVVFTNQSGPGTCAGGNVFTVAVPSAPVVVITGQAKNGQTVTITGTVSGYPVSGEVALVPDAVAPGGAIAKTIAMAIDDNGTFSAIGTTVAYGSYQPPVASVVNFSGSSTDAGDAPIALYAPGTQPPGLPVVSFPAFIPPVFTTPAVAINGVVTTLTLQNTGNTALSDSVFTVGQPFKRGDLAPTDFLIGKVAGEADIALQFNVKATHPDGSVRHALISGIGPALAVGVSKTMSLVRTNVATSTTPVASGTIAASGFSASAELSIGGIAYHADVTPKLLQGVSSDRVWIGGAIASEYIVDMPLVDNDGVEHPLLTAQFNVRFYPGNNAAKVDVTIESTKAYPIVPPTDVVYSGTLRIGGVDRFTIKSNPSATTLTHFHGARWKKTFWWNNSNPVHIKHNIDYLLDSKQLPNYDRRVIVPESNLAEAASRLLLDAYWPMGSAGFESSMGTTGGRGDIGLAPSGYAAYVLSMDKRAKDSMLGGADGGGSWNAHRRDNSEGPARGRPMDIVHWPRATILGSGGDSLNRETGKQEKLPGSASASPLAADSSHQPAFAYIPYLVTGDFYYLEEMHFWNNWNLYRTNPAYRDYERGVYRTEQLRGQGWNTRTLAECAAITPDAHPDKQAFRFWLDNVLGYYNSSYTDSATANQLGIIVDGATVVYDLGGNRTGVGPWQDDFFTQSVGHASELGFTEAGRLLGWKAKFQVGRMIDPGVCWIHAASFTLRVREAETAPFYTSLAQCYANTLAPELYAMPCNTPERLAKYIEMTGNTKTILGEMLGYSSSNTGYPSNFQPALSMAVDSGAIPDGDLAWDLFENRTVKPEYGMSPQFAIVPRSVELPPPPPPGAPGKPLDVVATAFDGIATITFDPPTSNGGSAINNFTVTASTGASVIVTGSPATMPVTIGVPVTFKVRATNGIDTGPDSDPSVSITPIAAPSASVSLKADLTGTPAASLTSLKWAWFDKPTPDQFAAPTDKGSAESTDANGVLTIKMPSSTLTSGQIGWLVVTNSNGTATGHQAFSGPVVVA